MARVLIACESSGVVREAFRAAGHDAWSCDLLPADDASPHHYQCDARKVLGLGWDLAGFHPPCTYLSVSGMHWTVRGLRDPKLTEEAIAFAELLWDVDIPHIYLENPVGVLSTRSRLGEPTQIIQPFQFGNPESKKTCLWLRGLPPLVRTHVQKPDLFGTPVLPIPANGRWENQTASGQNKLGPSADRWKARSRTYPGIAAAKAAQWGVLL